jgi:hypothetical protein
LLSSSSFVASWPFLGLSVSWAPCPWVSYIYFMIMIELL